MSRKSRLLNRSSHLAWVSALVFSISPVANAEDWVHPTGAEWQGLVSGNTVEHSDGRWAVYYNSNGQKMVKVGSKVTERKWWQGADGAWCETMYRDSAEKCQATMDIEVDGDTVRKTKSYGGTDWRAKIKKGNPHNL